MSIFAKVTKEDDSKLAERYQHLLLHARNLGIEDTEQLRAKVGLEDGLTKANLDDFQIAIECAANQAEMRVETKETFSINSWDRVDWLMRKQIAAQAIVDVTKLALKDAQAEVVHYTTGLFQEQAEAFAMAEYKRTGEKTVKRPHGRVTVTNYAPSWKIEDEPALQEWLSNLKAGDMAFFEVYPKTYTRNLELLKSNAEKGSITPAGLKKDPGGDKVSLRYPKEV